MKPDSLKLTDRTPESQPEVANCIFQSPTLPTGATAFATPPVFPPLPPPPSSARRAGGFRRGLFEPPQGASSAAARSTEQRRAGGEGSPSFGSFSWGSKKRNTRGGAEPGRKIDKPRPANPQKQSPKTTPPPNKKDGHLHHAPAETPVLPASWRTRCASQFKPR